MKQKLEAHQTGALFLWQINRIIFFKAYDEKARLKKMLTSVRQIPYVIHLQFRQVWNNFQLLQLQQASGFPRL